MDDRQQGGRIGRVGGLAGGERAVAQRSPASGGGGRMVVGSPLEPGQDSPCPSEVQVKPEQLLAAFLRVTTMEILQ